MSTVVPIVTIILLLISVGQQVYSRKIYGYFDALFCQDYDVNCVDIVECWLTPDQNGQLMMNAEFRLKKDLTSLKNKFQFIVEVNKRNITYLSLDIDICTILGAAEKNPLVRLMLEEIRRTSNLPLACPLKKGITYAIRNFTIDSKLIPPFAPRLRWIADSNFYTNTGKSMDNLLHYVSTGRVDHIKPKVVTPA